jgi:hypothetical protein
MRRIARSFHPLWEEPFHRPSTFRDPEGQGTSTLSRLKMNDYVNVQLAGASLMYLAKYFFPYV